VRQEVGTQEVNGVGREFVIDFIESALVLHPPCALGRARYSGEEFLFSKDDAFPRYIDSHKRPLKLVQQKLGLRLLSHSTRTRRAYKRIRLDHVLTNDQREEKDAGTRLRRSPRDGDSIGSCKR